MAAAAPEPVKVEKESCCCDDANKLADQDFFGLVQKLSPNLYKVLAEKAFMLDTPWTASEWTPIRAQSTADPRRGTIYRVVTVSRERRVLLERVSGQDMELGESEQAESGEQAGSVEAAGELGELAEGEQEGEQAEDVC